MTRRISLLLASLVLLAVVAPWFAPYSPESRHTDFMHAPPMRPHLLHDGDVRMPFVYSIALADRVRQDYVQNRSMPQPLPWFGDALAPPVFLIGADSFGRDLLSRLLHGARVTISLALVSVLGAIVVGVVIGSLAGYRGGWLDEVAMRTADFVVILPVIYVVLLLRAVLPMVLSATTVFALMAGIFALVGWPFVARGVRGIMTAERDREYVVAAQSLGASSWRIVSRHLLPACVGYLLVQATLLLPSFILAEATLSYVGLGFPATVPTWGTMLREAANVTAMTRFPWTLVPAVAIFLVVLAANVILQSDKIKREGAGRASGAGG